MVVDQCQLRLDLHSHWVSSRLVDQPLLLGLGQPRRGADDRLVQGEARLPFQLDIFDEVGVSGEVYHSFEVIWW